MDYPGQTSLKQIYGTFNRAMLRPITMLRGFAESLTEAMVDVYLQSQVNEFLYIKFLFFNKIFRKNLHKTINHITYILLENLLDGFEELAKQFLP